MQLKESIKMETLKQRLLISLDKLPPDGVKEIISFLEYINYKFGEKISNSTTYKPISLGGLWKNKEIQDEDIDEIRREIWGSLGEKEL